MKFPLEREIVRLACARLDLIRWLADGPRWKQKLAVRLHAADGWDGPPLKHGRFHRFLWLLYARTHRGSRLHRLALALLLDLYPESVVISFPEIAAKEMG